MSDTRFEWPMYRHTCRQAEAFDRMMARTGVDPRIGAALDRGSAFLAARAKCIACPAAGACRDWLARVDPLPVAPPGFCANGPFLHRCLERQGARRPPAA